MDRSIFNHYQNPFQNSYGSQQHGLTQNTVTEQKKNWETCTKEKDTALNNFRRALETADIDIPLLHGISNQSKTIQKERQNVQIQPSINRWSKIAQPAEYQNSALYTKPICNSDDKLAKTLKSRVAAQTNRDKKKAYVKGIEESNTQLLQKVKQLEAQLELLQHSNSDLWKDLLVAFEKIESEYDDYFNMESLSPNIGDIVPDYDDLYDRKY